MKKSYKIKFIGYLLCALPALSHLILQQPYEVDVTVISSVRFLFTVVITG